MRMRNLSLVVILSLVGLVGIAHAVDITVKTDGSGDHATIQAALDVAQPGDVVIVHPGTYVEDINIGSIDMPPVKKDDITLKAAEAPEANGPTVTVQFTNTSNRAPALADLGADFGENDKFGFFVYGDNTLIDGIKFAQHETEPNALGIVTTVIVISSNVTIQNCEVEGPGGDAAGDIVGIAITPLDIITISQGGSALATNMMIKNCNFHDIPYAAATANLPLELGLPVPSPVSTIVDCEFKNCASAIELDNGDLLIENCHFDSCESAVGIGDDSATIRGCLIENSLNNGMDINDSELEDDDPADLPKVTIEDCIVLNSGMEGDDYGIFIETGTVIIRNTIVSGSTNANMMLQGTSDRDLTVTVENCDFYNSLIGMGISTPADPQGVFNLTMTNCNIVDIEGVDNTGVSLVDAIFDHCNIFTSGLQFVPDDQFLILDTILNVDPMYVDPANGDFTLQADSPVATAGKDGGHIGARGIASAVSVWMLH